MASATTTTSSSIKARLPDGMTQIVPYIYYRDVFAAIDWLEKAFGFEKLRGESTPSGGVHGEMRFGDGVIMMGNASDEYRMKSPRDLATSTQGVFIYVDDVDAHYARAKAAGAEIVTELADQSYGRTYWARDLEGHDWFFTAPPAK